LPWEGSVTAGAGSVHKLSLQCKIGVQLRPESLSPPLMPQVLIVSVVIQGIFDDCHILFFFFAGAGDRMMILKF
jgi:hypothetical protein